VVSFLQTVILKRILKQCMGFVYVRAFFVDYINLAYGRDKGGAVVKTVMNMGFHKMLGNFWQAEEPLPSQE